MSEIADWITLQDFGDWDGWEDESKSLTDEPVIWTDNTGQRWQLSEMETSHLIFINRLVINQWALALGLRPVPIKNPVAILDPDRTPEQVIDVALRARRMAEEVLRRLDEGEQLDGGVRVVWDRVVNKIQECLRKSGQPLDKKLLAAASLPAYVEAA